MKRVSEASVMVAPAGSAPAMSNRSSACRRPKRVVAPAKMNAPAPLAVSPPSYNVLSATGSSTTTSAVATVPLIARSPNTPIIHALRMMLSDLPES